MKIALSMLLLVLSFLVPLLVVGIIIGLLFEWLYDVERGIAVLIGVVATGFAMQLLLYSTDLMHQTKRRPRKRALESYEDDEEEAAHHVQQIVMHAISPKSARRKHNTK